MGLGKTLQAITIIGSDTWEKRKQKNLEISLTSLVVCPSSIVRHWFHEVKKFVEEDILEPVMYIGCFSKRQSYVILLLFLTS